MFVHWAIPEKIQTVELRTYFFEKDSWNFLIFTLLLESQDKMKLPPCKFHKTPIGISNPKHQDPMETRWLFMTLGNSTSLLIDPWNFCILFLQCPWKFHVLSLPCLDFSAISHSCSHSYISDYWLYLVTGRYCTRKVHMNIMKNENVVNNGRDKRIFSWGETRFYRCIVLLCLLWNFRSWFWSLLTKKII